MNKLKETLLVILGCAVSSSVIGAQFSANIQTVAHQKIYHMKPDVEQTQLVMSITLVGAKVAHKGAIQQANCDVEHQISATQQTLKIVVKGQLYSASNGQYLVKYPGCNVDLTNIEVNSPDKRVHGVIRQAPNTGEVTLAAAGSEQVKLYRQQSLVPFSYVEA